MSEVTFYGLVKNTDDNEGKKLTHSLAIAVAARDSLAEELIIMGYIVNSDTGKVMTRWKVSDEDIDETMLEAIAKMREEQ
jgi:hypothetical protein